MTPWSDTHRFNQSGYSSPTIFPHAHLYDNLDLFQEDIAKAISREQSHRDWMLEEQYEARMEYLVEQAETKALREEYYQL